MKTNISIKLCIISVMFAVSAPIQAEQKCNIGRFGETTPASRFTINADNTVSDKESGLIWKRCSQGQSGSDCKGEPTLLDWKEGRQAAQDEDFASHTDWRVPTTSELLSIVESACSSPSINIDVFPNTPGLNTDFGSLFLSIPEKERYLDDSAYVSFHDGDDEVTPRVVGLGFSVRLVRGGN